MMTSTNDLSAADVVRAYREADVSTLYGVWRPCDLRQRKTFSLHMSDPTDSLRPAEMVLEISDGRVFAIDQPSSYEQRPGEHGLAWTQVPGRPTIRTPAGPKSSIPFEPEADEKVPPPKPGRWWQK